MATRVIDDSKLQNIAVAIQGKDNGGQMTVDEMPGRITSGMVSRSIVNEILGHTVEDLININPSIIAEAAMSGCTSLKRIIISEGTISIKNRAFELCSSIEYIILPNTLMNIGSSAFGQSKFLYNCKYIKFQSSPYIIQYAFSGLVTGTDLIDFRGVHSSPTLSDANAFNGLSNTENNTRIVVDDDSVKAIFQSATNLSVYYNKIVTVAEFEAEKGENIDVYIHNLIGEIPNS